MTRYLMERLGPDVRNALFITLAYVLTRLIFILLMPLMLDESLYSIMISSRAAT